MKCPGALSCTLKLIVPVSLIAWKLLGLDLLDMALAIAARI
jgi:hypothetical protein